MIYYSSYYSNADRQWYTDEDSLVMNQCSYAHLETVKHLLCKQGGQGFESLQLHHPF
jgi:hypothetical protein